VKGLALATWRVARCNPFGGHGVDPVPEKKKKASRRV
jgi:putative component of membrane protein insertase Oxa1/YidC/SpoIIIJ protein YidD